MGKYDQNGVYVKSKAEQKDEYLKKLIADVMSTGVWRDVVIRGYPSNYKACDDGRILNMRNGRLVNGSKNEKGYYKIEISYITPEGVKSIKTGKYRIIAQAFIPNPYNLPEVRHKNGINDDDRAENLEWVSESDNTKISVEGRSARTTPDHEIKQFHVDELPSVFTAIIHNGMSDEKLAEMFKLPTHTVTRLRGIVEYVGDDMPYDCKLDMKWSSFPIAGETNVKYQASKYGLIRNVEKDVLVPGTVDLKDGYVKVQLLYGDGKILKTPISKVIATAFIPNPENKTTVTNLDGNKMHDWVENLRWSTLSEHAQYIKQFADVEAKKGSDNGRSVYTEDQIIRACELMMKITPPKIIERETGVKRIDQYAVRSGMRWCHIGSRYDFPKGKFKNTGEFVYDDGRVVKPEEMTMDLTLLKMSKYTDNQILKVCEMLMKPDKYTMDDISKATDVPYHIIYNVKSGKMFQEISKNFNFPRVAANGISRKIIPN